jgi:hypothetical protein
MCFGRIAWGIVIPSAASMRSRRLGGRGAVRRGHLWAGASRTPSPRVELVAAPVDARADLLLEPLGLEEAHPAPGADEVVREGYGQRHGPVVSYAPGRTCDSPRRLCGPGDGGSVVRPLSLTGRTGLPHSPQARRVRPELPGPGRVDRRGSLLPRRGHAASGVHGLTREDRAGAPNARARGATHGTRREHACASGRRAGQNSGGSGQWEGPSRCAATPSGRRGSQGHTSTGCPSRTLW